MILSLVGKAALEVADIRQWEVERSVLYNADEPHGGTEEGTTLRHQILQLHPVFAPSECE